MNEEQQRHLDLALAHLAHAVRHLVHVPIAHNAAILGIKLVMIVRGLGANPRP